MQTSSVLIFVKLFQKVLFNIFCNRSAEN